MVKDKYITLKLDRDRINELDELLVQTIEFKTRASFIYKAIREYMIVTRIKNNLTAVGQDYFTDLLVIKRRDAYDEAKKIQTKWK